MENNNKEKQTTVRLSSELFEEVGKVAADLSERLDLKVSFNDVMNKFTREGVERYKNRKVKTQYEIDADQIENGCDTL